MTVQKSHTVHSETSVHAVGINMKVVPRVLSFAHKLIKRAVKAMEFLIAGIN